MSHSAPLRALSRKTRSRPGGPGGGLWRSTLSERFAPLRSLAVTIRFQNQRKRGGEGQDGDPINAVLAAAGWVRLHPRSERFFTGDTLEAVQTADTTLSVARC